MKRVQFNRTDLRVSPLCLGTVNYGSALPDAEAARQMSQFVDLGGNFIDTARIYGVWANRGPALSEKIVGKWCKDSGRRHEVVIATKGCHPEWESLSTMRVHPGDIENDLNKSLTNLETDCIDLYFLHRDDVNVPVEEILLALETARRAGKIRYYGCSNWTLERVRQAELAARREGFQGFVCNQLMWSLADIRFQGLADKTFVLMDRPTYEYHEQTGMNAMAYMSVAKGYFMRRMAGETLPASVTDIYALESNDRMFERMCALRGDANASPLTLSLSYLMHHPFPSVPIASFDNETQLIDAMKCCEAPVDAELLGEFAGLKKFVL